MRRLAIIDVAGGDQPITNEDRTIWVLLNGEIYNFQELRSELKKCGHDFITNSDTEVIVHAMNNGAMSPPSSQWHVCHCPLG